MLDTQVDFSHIQFGRSIRKLNMQLSGNEHGITGAPFALVHHPKLTVRQSIIQEITPQPAPAFNSAAAVVQAESIPPNSPPSYTDATNVISHQGVAFPQRQSVLQAPRRRPVPQPPAPTRKVKAIHDFAPESAEELDFAAGDIIEILDDKSDDGWWKGRLSGKTGLIPSPFVENFKIMDTTPAVESLKESKKSLVTEIVVPLDSDLEQPPAQDGIQKVQNTGSRRESLQATLASKEVEAMESHFPVVSPVVPAQKMDNQHKVSSPSRIVTEPTVNSIQQ